MIKLRRRLARSLDATMLYMILVSLAVALAVYGTVYGLASLALDKIYMSPSSVASRQAKIYAEFSQYVSENGVYGSDPDAAARFNKNSAYVTVLIYPDEELEAASADKLRTLPGVERTLSRESVKLYPMRFADGLYHISIEDNSDAREDALNRVIAVILGALAFFTIVLTYVRKLTRRIIRLSREADAIGAGDLDAPITLQGEDELSTLAREMDGMRRSVIQRMSGERRAWEANSELITAISHDIRTPMTALIGYLGLLNEGALEDSERASAFASSAYDKAIELKELTDELFKYFLVFGRSELELNMETLDGRLLLEQLLGEAEFDLTDAGLTVQQIPFEGDCALSVDPLYIKRVIDNLVSNAKKYSDRTQPVVFLTELRDGVLTVSASNCVSRTMDKVESTKIGLRTCEKIMQAMGGSFETRRDENHFAASFSLPALPLAETNEDGSQ